MSARPQLSEAEFDALLDQRLAGAEERDRDARWRNLPPEARLALALPPSWTAPLAEAAKLTLGGPPVEVFEDLVRTGVLNVVRLEPAPGEAARPAVYSITPDARQETLASYLRREDGPAELRRTVVGIARSMLDAGEHGTALLPSVRRWAILAAAADKPGQFPVGPDREEPAGDKSAGFAAALDREVEATFKAANPDETLNWAAAARPLAELLSKDGEPGAQAAVTRAYRRLELLYRREYDEAQLKFFQERPAATAAFAELMAEHDPAAAWALHYLGAGGVGKTMVLRHIILRLAQQWDAACARVDFDFLPPDYPRLDPGLLLSAFAQELRPQERSSGASRAFDGCERALFRLRGRLAHEYMVAGGRATDQATFRDGLSLFIDACRAMRRPIVLVLDTCEELSRIGPDGTIPENVAETFRILEGLRYGSAVLDRAPGEDLPPLPDPPIALPDLRIVFAGRRPLAGAGRGWTCRETALPPRPYLRVHELRGFTFEEAGDFLRQKMNVAAKFIPAIIDQSSPDTGPTSDITWANPADAPAMVPRCNPYDLRMFADWANEDPPPTVAEIEAATPAQFIELRILQRLHYPQLANVLPAVALMGHVDRATLTAISAVDDDTLDLMFAELARQEWTGQRMFTSRVEGASHLVLDINAGLRQRLLDYYAPKGVLPFARSQAAAYLEQLTLTTEMAGLDWSVLDAAANVLAVEPERAFAWWRRVEARILAERDLQWAYDVTRSLAGSGGDEAGALPEPPDLVRLAIRGTYAAALLHRGNRTASATAWREVAAGLAALPPSLAVDELRLRALAGEITAEGGTSEPAAAQSFWQALAGYAQPLTPGSQVVAALVGAAETLVELAETRGAGGHQWLPPLPASPHASLRHDSIARRIIATLLALRRAARLTASAAVEKNSPNTFDPAVRGQAELAAFALALAGRALVLIADLGGAAGCLNAALALAPLVPVSPGDDANAPVARGLPWAGWLAPGDIPARVRLEYIRALYPAQAGPAVVLAAVDYRPGEPSPAAHQGRALLLSACLQLRLAEAPIPIAELLSLGWSPGAPTLPAFDAGGGVRQPAGNAESATPPLFVTLATAAAAAGMVDAALPGLSSVLSQTDAFAAETLRHAERALLTIARRWRLRDEGEARSTLLGNAPDPADNRLAWALDGLEGARCPPGLPSLLHTTDEPDLRLAELHAAWQTCYTLDDAHRQAALAWAQANLVLAGTVAIPGAAGLLSLATWLLDILEVSLVDASGSTGAAAALQAADPADVWLVLSPAWPAEALALALRARALGVREWDLLDAATARAKLAEPAPSPPASLADLAGRLGRRRAAEIALFEGEMLALRLPDAAAGILEQALDWYVDAHDDAGSLQAAVALAMARAAGQQSRATDGALAVANLQLGARTALPAIGAAADRLGEAAAVWPGDAAALPQWDPIYAAAQGTGTVAVETWAPRGWRPWAVRAAVAAFIAHQPPSPETGAAAAPGADDRLAKVRRNLAELQAWAQAHYGSGDPNAPRLPADLETPLQGAERVVTYTSTLTAGAEAPVVAKDPAVAVPGAASAPATAEPRPAGGTAGAAPAPSAGPDWGTWAAIALGAVLALGIVAGLFFLLRWLFGAAVPGIKSWSVAGQVGGFLGLVVGGLLLAGIASVAAEAIRDALARQCLPGLRVQPAGEQARGTTSSTAVLPTVNLRLVFQGWQPRARLLGLSVPAPRRPAPLPTAVKVDLTNDYRAEAGKLPAGLAADLRWLDGWLSFGPPLQFLVETTPGSEQWPWEALLALAAQPEAAKAGDLKLAFRRTWPGRRQRLPTAGPARNVVVTWGGAEFAVATIRMGWQPATEDQRWQHTIVGSNDTLSEGQARVLHLVGEAEDSTAGLRFRLSQDEQLLKSGAGLVAAPMLRAEDIAQRQPGLGLCILQAPPADASDRLASDRLAAARQRLFAAQLFAAGIPAVLALPALPPEQVTPVLQKLAARLFALPAAGQPAAGGRFPASTLVQGVAEIQHQILPAAAIPLGPVLWEIALDICLYATDD